MKPTNKEIALQAYKQTKVEYVKDQSNSNWIALCNAKRTCMLLGIRI